MADLRNILDVKSLKEPIRPLNTLLKNSTEEARASIVRNSRADDITPDPLPAAPAPFSR